MISTLYVRLSVLGLIALWLGQMPSDSKIFATGALLGGIVPCLWIDTFLQCGWGCAKSIPLMAGIFHRTKRGGTLTLIVVFCFLIWLSPFAVKPLAYRFEMSLILLLTVAGLWLQPPYALMLGSSTRETGSALGRISSILYPMRIVGLLDPKRTGWPGGSYATLTDCLRTESEKDWRDIVDGLTDLVLVNVLDSRTDSPVVVSEAGAILSSPHRLARTLFIVHPDGSSAALALNGASTETPGVIWCFEEQLEAALSRFRPPTSGIPSPLRK